MSLGKVKTTNFHFSLLGIINSLIFKADPVALANNVNLDLGVEFKESFN